MSTKWTTFEQFLNICYFFRQCLSNIYNLLRKEGGDFLLIFLASNPIYDAYVMTSRLSKWSKYMFDVKSKISPLQYVRKPDQQFADIMSEVGFSKFEVKLLHKHFEYESFEVYKGINLWEILYEK